MFTWIRCGLSILTVLIIIARGIYNIVLFINCDCAIGYIIIMFVVWKSYSSYSVFQVHTKLVPHFELIL